MLRPLEVVVKMKPQGKGYRIDYAVSIEDPKALVGSEVTVGERHDIGRALVSIATDLIPSLKKRQEDS